jgi:hypothetical protein
MTGGIVNQESDVGGFPVLPVITRDASWDTDHDGMPDIWETAHGLNPSLAADRNNDFDTDGYTNLEEYINEAGAWPAPRPITWTGGTGRYALNSNWDTWQPSRFDEARINSGVATVDAVGQHARSVKIGTNAGDNAALNITAGWLMAEEQVTIGADNGATAALNLSGGSLTTPLLTKGAGGSFNFTGGTLHADTVGFSLVNNGGTIAPGHSPGVTHIMGNLTLNSTSTLEIEVGGRLPNEYDRVLVDGLTMLGGKLKVTLIDLGTGPIVPQLGDTFGFLASQLGTGGHFDSFDLPALAPGLAWDINPGNVTNFLIVVAIPGLAGDYNNDGAVDTADYTIWRDQLGKHVPLQNETASPGNVDQADYDVWRTNFGKKAAGAGSVVHSTSQVPEPAAIFLATLCLMIAGSAKRWRSAATD